MIITDAIAALCLRLNTISTANGYNHDFTGLIRRGFSATFPTPDEKSIVVLSNTDTDVSGKRQKQLQRDLIIEARILADNEYETHLDELLYDLRLCLWDKSVVFGSLPIAEMIIGPAATFLPPEPGSKVAGLRLDLSIVYFEVF